MSMFDHDERWTQDEMRDIARIWIREGHMDALLSGFAGHPDEQFAARAVAEMTAPKKEKPREIRFVPPADRFDRWQKAANALGVPLTIWVQLAADAGIAFGQPPAKPVESVTAPVQETTQEMKAGKLERPPNGWLRERIVTEMGDKPLRASDVPTLARKLGETSHSVFSSLGSMSARGRVHHDKQRNVYQIVKES
jgi:hypothetical protein